ncbi:MAG: formylglycine-generating enzyme family protein [Desulfobulbus sp.]|nr:formylglycine-generating enzyme family protein [Desulfobulbus sp.]
MDEQVRQINDDHFVMPYNGYDMHLVRNNDLFDALSQQNEIVFGAEEVTLLQVFKEGMTDQEWNNALQTIFDLKSVFPGAKISRARGLIRYLCGTEYATSLNGFFFGNRFSTWNNQIGMQFSFITPGEFLMGTDADQYASPRHNVTISKSFSISRHPVSQQQFERVVGSNPSRIVNPDAPVDCVAYHEALAFIDLLNKIEQAEYRLPTEAQWEYVHHVCDMTAQEAIGKNTIEPMPVIERYMDAGEWVSDWWGAYPADTVSDPSGPEHGRFRVVRKGGSCTARSGAEPDKKMTRVGFRIVHP